MTEIAVLGFLNEGEMNGYELRRHILRRLGDYTKMQFGSIYHALSNFEERGWIKATSEKEEGAESKRYRLTRRGKAALKDMVLAELKDAPAYVDPIGTSLALIYNLTLEEAASALSLRLTRLEAEKANVEVEKKRVTKIPGMTGFIEIIFDHGLQHLDSEIEWLRSTIRNLRKDPGLLTPPKLDASHE